MCGGAEAKARVSVALSAHERASSVGAWRRERADGGGCRCGAWEAQERALTTGLGPADR